MAEIKVDSFSHNRNLAKIKKEEEELEALLRGDAVNEEEEQEEEPAAEEPSSDVSAESEPENEGDTEQEEASQAEAQEDDDAGLSAEEANFKKRYGDLRRHQQAKEAEYKKRLADLEDRLTNGTTPDASPEQIQAWAKKNPQAEKVIRALADQQAQEKLKDVESRLAEVEELRIKARKEKAEAALYAMHPDFEEIRNDDSFHAWAKEQPEVMQSALYDNPDDVKGVSRVLDLYKADKGIAKKQAVKSDKKAASSVKSRSRATPEADESKSYLSESAIQKMSAKEFEERYDEIEAARKSGKFVYDLSRR